MSGFIPVLWVVSGFLLAQIAQRVIVPLLVQLIGERHFAETSAFDGCTLGIVGGFICPILPVFLKIRHLSLWWTPIIILAIFTSYGLFWLWAQGWGAHGREWVMAEGTVKRRKDDVVLKPLSLRQREDYHQTDAFNGFSHYFLDLYDETGQLATNGYTSEAARDRDIAELKSIDPTIRTLDLTLVWRAEPLKWREVRFFDVWAPLLGGTLDRLGETDREWWRQWLGPRFSGEETVLDVVAWKEHLERLRLAYSDYPAPPRDEKDWQTKADGELFRMALLDIDGLFTQDEGPIIAMSNEAYVKSAREAAGPGFLTFCHELDGFVHLQVSN